MAHEALLSDIEKFLADTGMGVSYFGEKAVGNSKLVKRLRAGRPIQSDTADRLRGFMRSEMAERRRHAQQILASASSGALA